MAFRVEVTPHAKQDANAILEWLLAQHAGEAGLRWFRKLEDAIASLAELRAGQAIERRNIILRDAHALRTAEGKTAMIRNGEDRGDPRRQRPWHVRKSSRGNREIS